jgi:hypothetical protein
VCTIMAGFISFHFSLWHFMVGICETIWWAKGKWWWDGYKHIHIYFIMLIIIIIIIIICNMILICSVFSIFRLWLSLNFIISRKYIYTFFSMKKLT